MCTGIAVYGISVKADIRGLPFHRLVCGEIVEPIVRRVCVDSNRVPFKDWADEG
jgi:hypothetical protein